MIAVIGLSRERSSGPDSIGISANGNVIDGAFIFDAKPSGHRHKLQNHDLAIDPGVQN